MRQPSSSRPCAPAPAAVRLLLLALVLSAPVAPARAAVALLTVGGDAACDFHTGTLPSALQAAVDAVPTEVPAGDLYVVRVARSGSYVGVDLVIEDRSLRLEGGLATCASVAPDATNTVLDANGAPGALLDVIGTSARTQVTLANLTLTGATGTAATGLRVRDADVALSRVVLEGNTGGIRGGGAHVERMALGASLTLSGGSVVRDNTVTQEGGGIYCGRGAELRLHADTTVTGNRSGVYGGGIYINGCNGFINSGAAGLEAFLVNIGGNHADFGGGGVYVGSSLAPSHVVMGEGVGFDDPRPVLLFNTAGTQGGGIYAVGEDTELVLRNAQVVGNESGSTGGAIQVRNGARVVVEGTLRRCGGTIVCSRISDNTANLGGAAAVGGTGAELLVRATRIDGNTGNLAGSAIYNQTGGAYVRLENVLVTGNTGPSVIDASSLSSSTPRATVTEVVASTIAGNTGATRMLDFNDEGAATISLSIVHSDDGSVPAVEYGAGNMPVTSCSLFHETASLGTPGPGVAASATPGFVDAAAGDYHLRPGGAGVDRCAGGEDAPAQDIEQYARPYDMPIFNLAGPFDVGAFEANPLLFADDFESGP